MEPARTFRVADPASREKIKRRQQLRILAACVLIAAALWFLRAFENEYTTFVDHPVRYINIPDKMITMSPLPEQISLEVKGLGFSILRHNWSFSKTPLVIDIRTLAPSYGSRNQGFTGHVALNPLLNVFSAQLNDLRVLAVKPDTLTLRFAVTKTRTVPVTPLFNGDSGTLPDQGSFVGIIPASVEVTGPDLLLDTLRMVYTEPMKPKRNGEPFQGSLRLKNPDKLLKFKPESVTITIQNIK
jgi:hypothetical protein